MSISSVHKDYDTLTITLVAEFGSSVDQVWELWADPRKLERWWGPPGFPATVEAHDLTPGGRVTYSMTGPDGDSHHGVWHIAAVEPPSSLEFTDSFADPEGTPAADMPASTIAVRLGEREGGTRMETRVIFESRADMDRWEATGTADGMREAMAQMEALLP